jgi:hypothetical protein
MFRPDRLAYQPPTSIPFLSEQTSHQQSVNSTFLSEQISNSHQPSAKRTGSLSLLATSQNNQSQQLEYIINKIDIFGDVCIQGKFTTTYPSIVELLRTYQFSFL